MEAGDLQDESNCSQAAPGEEAPRHKKISEEEEAKLQQEATAEALEDDETLARCTHGTFVVYSQSGGGAQPGGSESSS